MPTNHTHDPALMALTGRIAKFMPAGTSAKQLAVQAQLAPEALQRVLQGRRGVSTTEITNLAQAMGVDRHWLVTGQPDPHAMRVYHHGRLIDHL